MGATPAAQASREQRMGEADRNKTTADAGGRKRRPSECIRLERRCRLGTPCSRQEAGRRDHEHGQERGKYGGIQTCIHRGNTVEGKRQQEEDEIQGLAETRLKGTFC